MSAGAFHTVFVKVDGTAWSTGWNAYGQLGDGTKSDKSTPVQVLTLTEVQARGEQTMANRAHRVNEASTSNNGHLENIIIFESNFYMASFSQFSKN